MSLEIKAIVALVLVALLTLGAWALHHEIYQSGYTAGAASVRKSWDDVNARAAKALAEQKAAADKAIAPIQTVAEPQIHDSQVRTVVLTKTVTQVIHDHPTFAACTRPAELGSVRSSQLEAAARAAGGYAPAPASSAPASAGPGAGGG